MYKDALLWSVVICVVTRLALWKSGSGSLTPANAAAAARDRTDLRRFQRSYLIVTLMAMFADWIQGPYGYALYASYGYKQGEIAMLYMGGFLSSMVAGSFVGAVADNLGRRRMCVVYAVFYAISCLVKLSTNYYILMFGRFFAGIATSLLFSSFEAWMVCEHHKRGFDPAALSETFGYQTLGNGLVAVLAGLVANTIADRYGYIGPFVFCLLPLTLVAILALAWWPENYGDPNSRPEMALPKAWSYIKSNAGIIYLGLGQSCFEGAMYAFVFSWTPALQAGGNDVGPYLGVIFSTFMVCTMIGSNIFGMAMNKNLLALVPIAVHTAATVANLVSFTSIDQTAMVYLSFLTFELTVGMFYPSYGSIKSIHIPEEVRSGVMNIFRVPLNAIMVVLLSLIEVQQVSIRTTLMLCTIIHGVGLLMYLNFEKLKKAPRVEYAAVAAVADDYSL